MPSLLDPLTGDEPDVIPPIPPPGLIEAVKADGGRRRANRHCRNVGVALLALAVLAVPAAVLRSGDGGRKDEISVASGGEGTETTGFIEPVEITPVTDPSAPVTPPPAQAGDTAPAVSAPPPATDPSPSVAPTTAAPRPAPTTTATTPLACRNSENPACGPFRWDPPLVPNQPLVASFTKAPTTAVVGQQVTFEVTWSDGDAQLLSERFSTDGTAVGVACMMTPKHGPWTPPPRAAGSGTLSYPTSFAAPGTYKVGVELATGDRDGPIDDDCNPPYGNETRLETTVTVSAA